MVIQSPPEEGRPTESGNPLLRDLVFPKQSADAAEKSNRGNFVCSKPNLSPVVWCLVIGALDQKAMTSPTLDLLLGRKQRPKIEP